MAGRSSVETFPREARELEDIRARQIFLHDVQQEKPIGLTTMHWTFRPMIEVGW